MMGSAHGQAEESYRGGHRAAQKEDLRTEGQDRQSAGRRSPASVAQAFEAGAAQEASPGAALGACARQKEKRPTGCCRRKLRVKEDHPHPSVTPRGGGGGRGGQEVARWLKRLERWKTPGRRTPSP